jgi:carboxypeptidase Taq
VTYPSHILLRYDIERALFAGTLDVAEIPAVWDSQMKELLGLSTVGNFKDGAMQDVHWPSGAFGYFPVYTFGALTAAQLHAALKSAIPELDAQLRGGQFGDLNAWLSDKVWTKASYYSSTELLVQATGEELSTRFFEEHLERRYIERAA